MRDGVCARDLRICDAIILCTSTVIIFQLEPLQPHSKSAALRYDLKSNHSHTVSPLLRVIRIPPELSYLGTRHRSSIIAWRFQAPIFGNQPGSYRYLRSWCSHVPSRTTAYYVGLRLWMKAPGTDGYSRISPRTVGYLP